MRLNTRRICHTALLQLLVASTIARGDKGPPEFRDAQIEVRDPSTKISIRLR